MKIGLDFVFRTFFNWKINNKLKEILKVDETNSESQIVIQAAKHGNLDYKTLLPK